MSGETPTPRTDALIDSLCPFLEGEVTIELEALARQLERELAAANAARIAAEAEVGRLNGLINTPSTADFFESAKLEAAHQQDRWGSDNDAGKEPQDWFWLLGYLSGKSIAAFLKGDKEKGLHHIISSAAVLLNWHRYATGELTAMRPGIEPPALAAAPLQSSGTGKEEQ